MTFDEWRRGPYRERSHWPLDGTTTRGTMLADPLDARAGRITVKDWTLFQPGDSILVVGPHYVEEMKIEVTKSWAYDVEHGVLTVVRGFYDTGRHSFTVGAQVLLVANERISTRYLP